MPKAASIMHQWCFACTFGVRVLNLQKKQQQQHNFYLHIKNPIEYKISYHVIFYD